jgi:ABC-type multidrug transport system ATPase subunit
MSTEFVLETDQLKKHFGSVRAVEDISLRVKRGEIFGFVGPNGAGKTTTISMILGLTYPTAGGVEVFGERVTPRENRVLRRVGTMVGSPALLLPFSARQNLRCLAHLYPALPAQRIDEVLELVGLKDVAQRQARKFSTGMKQRLGLALALLNKPDLLILDEPTNGMDPAGMHELRTLFRSLAEQGVTVFLSSHQLHEVELICDRVAVVRQGRLIAQGTVADLLSGTNESIRITTADPQRTAQILHSLAAAHDIQVVADSVEVRGVSSEVILYNLVNQGITPKEVAVSRPDLESVFLELTQKAG